MREFLQGTDDREDAVLGGEGRLLNTTVTLPDKIGNAPWPEPATQGSAEFMIPREDPAVRRVFVRVDEHACARTGVQCLCYKHCTALFGLTLIIDLN